MTLTFLLLVSIFINYEHLYGKYNPLIYIAVYLGSLHHSYAYVFNTVMHEEAVYSKTNKGQPINRAIFGFLGFAVIGLVYYGIWFWRHT